MAHAGRKNSADLEQPLGAEVTDTHTEALRVAAFAKFQPKYCFDQITEADIAGSKWRVLAVADIEDSDEEHFLGVISKWTKEAQLVIPPVDRTDILDSHDGDGCQDGQTDSDGSVTIVRTRRMLVPKRTQKDDVLMEDVVVNRIGSDIYARFIPLVESASGIPFYYPQVKEFAFGRLEPTSSDHSACQLAILARELAPGSTVATKKQQSIWKDLIKKLYKWTATERFGYQKRQVHDVLVGYEAYTAKYQELKAKYAAHWVENWPEQTDPRKFVYEDIAIASWIICLWETDAGNAKPSFVDLGCGNGLLVSILAEEGFSGFGIDQCSRKVWKRYSKQVDLRAETLEPFDFEADVDWIIGNHADELVPWIPVIAARSKPSIKFIVIPCCPHDLSGKKMAFPTTAGQSKYHAYIQHISELMARCGYVAEKEFLRIPSTKNVALVGRIRTHLRDKGVIDELVRSGQQAFVARVPDSVKNEIRMAKAQRRKQE
ncbi:tRNA(Ser) Um(44) 2'-O-methyltransferase [Dipsacomyces acuminosporus]|nr:tRNA(Ser) Um(44) 2'-O-methyltransferase [Dipsacomyces acuminosporus]